MVLIYYGDFQGIVSIYEPIIAIEFLSARAIIFSRSKIRVLPAVTERQVAPAEIIVSIVGTPTTGTSNRISWSGLATLTTVNFPFANSPARRIVASVPSIASIATHA